MICGKTVEKLAACITVVQRCTDHAQFIDCEYAVVDQRFFNNIEAEAAGIDKAIAERDREHDADSVLPEGRAHVGNVCGHACACGNAITYSILKDSLYPDYKCRARMAV